MSPVDNKFFELIIPIATFLTGTLSGIMLAGDDKDLRMKAIEAANKPPPPSAPSPSPVRAPVSPMSPMAAAPMAAAPMAAAPMAGDGPAMPTMAKPAPSRPPLDEDFPPLE